jgi:hypothetical protein
VLKVSPYLGSECDVAFDFVKRFPHNSEDSEDDFDPGHLEDSSPLDLSEMPSPESTGIPQENSPSLFLPRSVSPLQEDSPSPEIFSPEEAEIQGFYNVEAILKHKVRQGWRFLTRWEGFESSESTWEPIKAFVHPEGTLNSIFVAYCEFHRLLVTLQRAYALANKS